LTNLTHIRAKGRKKTTYLAAILLRQKWLDFLKAAELESKLFPAATTSTLKTWLKKKEPVSLTELDLVIQYHNIN